MPSVTIKKLKIERFRGLQSLVWRPAAGLNLILGGGDIGKAIRFDAVALLFNPTTAVTVAETDFFEREFADAFEIDATIAGGVEASLAPVDQKYFWRRQFLNDLAFEGLEDRAAPLLEGLGDG